MNGEEKALLIRLLSANQIIKLAERFCRNHYSLIVNHVIGLETLHEYVAAEEWKKVADDAFDLEQGIKSHMKMYPSKETDHQ